MADEQDIHVVALKCPNCGGALKVAQGSDRTLCEHCGSTVLIVDARTGETRIDSTEPETPEAAAARKRTIKILIWVIVLATVVPIFASLLVNIIIGIVSVLVGIITFGVTR